MALFARQAAAPALMFVRAILQIRSSDYDADAKTNKGEVKRRQCQWLTNIRIYSDCFDIEKEAQTVIKDMNQFEWENISFEEVVKNFSDFMPSLWKVHPEVFIIPSKRA